MEHPLRAHCKKMSRKGILVDPQLLIAGGQEGGIGGVGAGGGWMHSGMPGGQEVLQRERCVPGRKLPGIGSCAWYHPWQLCLFQTLPQSLRARPWPPPDSSGSSSSRQLPGFLRR